MIEDAKSLAEITQILTSVLQEKPNEWLPVYAALGGSLAGALGTFFPSFLIEKYKDKQESNRLLSSLLAEVQALLNIIEYREYGDSIKKIISYLKTQKINTTQRLTVIVPDHYCRIYQENAGKIGIIPYKHAHKIIIFYQLIDAVVQDVKPNGVLSNGTTIESFEAADIILTKAVIIGNELIQNINNN